MTGIQKWPFRSLSNYVDQHRKRASDMGVLAEFLAADTLTLARQLVFPKVRKS